MLIQGAFTSNTLFGLALLVGLSLLLTILTKVNILKGFICYALIISPFLYQSQLIELWVIVVLIIGVVSVILITYVNNRRYSI
jgi:hypothetical protein